MKKTYSGTPKDLRGAVFNAFEDVEAELKGYRPSALVVDMLVNHVKDFIAQKMQVVLSKTQILIGRLEHDYPEEAGSLPLLDFDDIVRDGARKLGLVIEEEESHES